MFCASSRRPIPRLAAALRPSYLSLRRVIHGVLHARAVLALTGRNHAQMPSKESGSRLPGRRCHGANCESQRRVDFLRINGVSLGSTTFPRCRIELTCVVVAQIHPVQQRPLHAQRATLSRRLACPTTAGVRAVHFMSSRRWRVPCSGVCRPSVRWSARMRYDVTRICCAPEGKSSLHRPCADCHLAPSTYVRRLPRP